MGSCNPKAQPLIPPKKQSLQFCCKKLKIHLELKQTKINQQIINGEYQLVKKINQSANQRDKFQELLLAQRIVNGLKYTAAYTLLIDYSISVANFASYICQNINDQKKMEPWQVKLYTLMYAAQKMPLTTLQQYRKCMQYIDDQILTQQFTDRQIKTYLTPQPLPQQMNIYFLQMSQRNNLSLQKINQVGHDFSQNFKPKVGKSNSNRKVYNSDKACLEKIYFIIKILIMMIIQALMEENQQIIHLIRSILLIIKIIIKTTVKLKMIKLIIQMQVLIQQI